MSHFLSAKLSLTSQLAHHVLLTSPWQCLRTSLPIQDVCKDQLKWKTWQRANKKQKSHLSLVLVSNNLQLSRPNLQGFIEGLLKRSEEARHFRVCFQCKNVKKWRLPQWENVIPAPGRLPPDVTAQWGELWACNDLLDWRRHSPKSILYPQALQKFISKHTIAKWTAVVVTFNATRYRAQIPPLIWRIKQWMLFLYCCSLKNKFLKSSFCSHV